MTTELAPLPIETAVIVRDAPLPPTNWAMMDAFEQFMKLVVADGRRAGEENDDTKKVYRQGVRLYLNWCNTIGITAAEASVTIIEDYRAYLYQKNSDATVQLYMTTVRRFYAAAKKYGLVDTNPVEGVRAGSDRTSSLDKMKALSEDGLNMLIKSVPGDTLAGKRDRVIVALMAIHGLRRVEVHRMDHGHINRDEWSVQAHGKGGKIRTVFFRDDSWAALEDWERAKAEAGFVCVGDEPVFVSISNNRNGKRLERDGLNYVVDKYLTETNLKKNGVSCHALRHTFGTLAVAGGAQVEQLREAMGHNNLETTGIYVKAVERRRNNPAQFINARMD